MRVVAVADPDGEVAERVKALANALTALTGIETFRASSRDTYPPRLRFLHSGAGLFLDMAVHDLDLARFLPAESGRFQPGVRC